MVIDNMELELRGFSRATVDELNSVVDHIDADLKNKQCCNCVARVWERIQDHDLLACCCDCRRPAPTYGILGGSCGLFLRLNAAFLDLVPKYQWVDAVAQVKHEFHELFDFYSEFVEPYLHTDTNALRDGGIGCGYLQKLYATWGEYDFAYPFFVKELLRCYGGNGQILSDDRQEIGLIVVESKYYLPMITPRQSGREFFVYHPDVEQLLMKYVGLAIFNKLKKITRQRDVEFGLFCARVLDVNANHVHISAEKLAPGKPIFRVQIGKNSTIEGVIRLCA